MVSDVTKRFLDESFATRFFHENRTVLGIPGQTILRCEANPRRISGRGGKSVIDYRLYLRDGERTATQSVVAEYRPDGGCERVFKTLKELWENGFGEGAPSICRPIAFFPAWNLLLRSRVEGVELADLLVRRGKSAETHVIEASRWLARLHRADVSSAPRRKFADEERDADTWYGHLKVVRPSLERRLRRIVIRSLQRIQRPWPTSFTHGDFHPKNILIGSTGLVVIDFDKSCIFDPAKDLGYFLAQLTIHSVRRGGYGLASKCVSLKDLFVKSYGISPKDESARIRGYEALSYIQHLHYDYWTLRREFNAEEFEYWLDAADVSLQREM